MEWKRRFIRYKRKGSYPGGGTDILFQRSLGQKQRVFEPSNLSYIIFITEKKGSRLANRT